MLDANELKRRLVEAMDKASPPVKSNALATACGVTPQAVNGWRETGRFAKRHLPKIAALTGRPLEYFLGEEPGAVATNFGLTLTLEEAEAFKRIQAALPNWRRYVLGLAMIDSKAEQALLLKTMQQTVPDSRVEQFVQVAPHAAARKEREKR